MTDRWIAAWTNVCFTYRKSILCVLAAVTAFAAWQLPHATFDNSLEQWFLKDDPALVAHRRLNESFSSDELIVVGYEAEDVFTPDVLAMIDRLTTRLADAPHVEKVFSLTNIEAIDGRGEELRIHDLVELPVDPAALPELRRRTLADNLYVGNVVSPAGDFTAVIVRLPYRTRDFTYKVEALTAIRAILASEAPERFYLAGGPVLDERFFELSDADRVRGSLLMIGALTLMMWLLLRNAAAMLLPIVTVAIAVVWAHGWIVLSGRSMNVITIMLNPLLLAVGIADSIHLLVEYQHRLRAGDEKMRALRGAYHELMTPMFLTSLTTAIGLLSLLVSRVQGVREFGVFGALGVLSAWAVSITLVPIVASYLQPMLPRGRRSASELTESAWLLRVHRFAMARGPLILAAAAVVAGVASVGAAQVKAESAFLEYFKDDERVKLDTEKVEDALGGVLSLEVLVDGGRQGALHDPELLASIDGLQRYMESSHRVSATRSITDYFRALRSGFFSNDPNERRLPDSSEEAAQYLLLYEMDAPNGDLKDLATYDYSQARVSARLVLDTSNTLAVLIDGTRKHIARNFPASVETEISGLPVLVADMEQYIRLSMIQGFSVALLAILVVFCILLRSIGLGLLAMTPNVLPILVCLGIMGFAGIRLDGVTTMVASVAIGLAVDDTIHFIGRVRAYLAAGKEMPEALRSSITGVGQALVFTSAALCAGFGTLLASDFVAKNYFGLLSLLTIVIALAADLLVMPVLLRWYAARRSSPAAAPAAERALG